jgi:hypothetical protein
VLGGYADILYCGSITLLTGFLKCATDSQYECPIGSLVPLDTARCPNLSEQELKQLEEAILNDPTAPDWLPECDGSYQDCVIEDGDVCVAGSTAHECETGVTCPDGITQVDSLSECSNQPA